MTDKQDPDQTMSSSQISVVSNALDNCQSKLRCVSKNHVTMMCLNPKCAHKNVFQCDKVNCQCRMNHKKCKKGDSEDVLSYVYSKIHNTKKFVDAIETMIEQKIKELADLKPVLLKQVEKRYKFTDLHDLERKFLGIVEGEVKIDELTPIESKQIWESANTFNDSKKTDIFDRLIKHVNQLSSSITSNITAAKNGINNDLILQEKYNKLVPEPICSKHLEPKDIALSHEIMKNSLICKNEELSGLLVKMFSKKIVKMQCIFTASKNEFNIGKYFEVCGLVPNTVIIAITNKEKIIGGFTPLTHYVENLASNGNATDTTGQSFLFSLTDREKFILNVNGQAINRYKEKNYIRFGYAAELQICDKADKQNSSYTYVNYGAYYNPAYSVNDKSAYLKFNGNETGNFTLTEWEVWKVEF